MQTFSPYSYNDVFTDLNDEILLFASEMFFFNNYYGLTLT